jgi:hypothetical protein
MATKVAKRTKKDGTPFKEREMRSAEEVVEDAGLMIIRKAYSELSPEGKADILRSTLDWMAKGKNPATTTR